MYYNQSCTPKGAAYGRWMHHPFMQSHYRAPVNIYKTETSYELLVFAPGRVKENFRLQAQGNELIISYHPAEAAASPDWIQKEYSRGAFERSFRFDDSVDITNVKATYSDGVLQVSLPVIPGKETPRQEIQIN